MTTRLWVVRPVFLIVCILDSSLLETTPCLWVVHALMLFSPALASFLDLPLGGDAMFGDERMDHECADKKEMTVPMREEIKRKRVDESISQATGGFLS